MLRTQWESDLSQGKEGTGLKAPTQMFRYFDGAGWE